MYTTGLILYRHLVKYMDMLHYQATGENGEINTHNRDNKQTIYLNIQE